MSGDLDRSSNENHESTDRAAAEQVESASASTSAPGAAAPRAHPQHTQLSDEVQALAQGLSRMLAATSQAGPESESQGVGLYQLVEAFTALRHDVKLHTKAARELGEQGQSALQALGQAAERFDRHSQWIESQQQMRESDHRLARPLAETLAELDEAVERVGGELVKARQRAVEQLGVELAHQLDTRRQQHQPWWRRWRADTTGEQRRMRQVCIEQVDKTLGSVLESTLKGYQLMQARMQQALEQQHIRRLDCVGKQVDPQTMRVIEVVETTEHTHGQVLEELRPGYLWGEQLLQTAEVRAAAAGGDRRAKDTS